MRLTIDKPALSKALGHVASVVERRNTIPILSNVLLNSANNELRLTATDLDMELVETVPVRGKGEGATTVPAHMFYDIVRKLPEGADIELKRDGEQGRLTITAGPAQFSLQTLPADDFPALSVDDLGHSFTLTAGELKRLIDKTRFAISTEETRYYLNGIYLHAAKNGSKPMLRAVATDGHRLAQVEHPLPSGAKDMPGVIVPRKTVLELAKLVEDGEGEVRIELSPSKIRVSTGKVVLTSKLIDGTFPDYERVIPQSNDKKLEVDNAAFAQAVDRVSTLSSDKGRAVKLSISDGNSCSRSTIRTAAAPRRNCRSNMAQIRWRSASMPAICWIFPGSSKAARPSSSSPIPAPPPWCATARMPRHCMCSCRCGYESRPRTTGQAGGSGGR
jgi:DNA polymerase-3 subunit beta